MDELPADFAENLARLVEPGHEDAVAEVIQAATRLDEESLRLFLEKFAARVRSSPERVRGEELLQLLNASRQPGPGGTASAP